jgi:hypothetical protein
MRRNRGKTPILDRVVVQPPGGTVVAKEKNRTRRVDKGKSGQALKTAVSGGFGGGILSQDLKQASNSFGGTELRL